MVDEIRAGAVARAARTPPGVEPGVTGKEKMFQQNRQFGPGAMKPYPFTKRPASSNRGNGVYYGRNTYGSPERGGMLNRGEERA